ncbi:MAG: trigger factor [Candidatus Magasanikbacteria bacterium]|nr:trigger factor [Candidatus Magasanikbacteria bacterium]
MQINLKILPKSMAELTIELSSEEIQPSLAWSAEQLSQTHNIPGFRPGKAPYHIIKQQLGEMKILETALPKIAQQSYIRALQEKNLKTVGQPEISFQKTAPGNPVIFTATFSLLPDLNLADWKQMRFKIKAREIGKEEVERVIKDLRKMQAREILVARPSQSSDKLVVDMDISLDKVPVEGGQSKNFNIYLDEDFYLPGLAEKLLNLQEGKTIEFKHPFPGNFFQKNLAGKNADFKITVKAVYERQLPDLNDDFAQSLKSKNLEDLKSLIKQNLEAEAKQKEEQKAEIEMLKTIMEKSIFGEIPEILINEEKQKMFAELKAGLADQGLSFEEYLKNIKKTEKGLAENFEQGALERAKTALILRQIAEKENISLQPEDLKKELKRLRELYKENEKIDERLAETDIQDFISRSLLNREVLKLLKQTTILK